MTIYGNLVTLYLENYLLNDHENYHIQSATYPVLHLGGRGGVRLHWAAF